MVPEIFRCLMVQRNADGKPEARLGQCRLSDLPPGDVIVRVAYSSLNYKDALATTGHPGIARKLPHVPGVDAAGTVARSNVPQFGRDDAVLVTGYELGAERWGGLAEYVRVPHDWVVALPSELSLRESMLIGTAGLTAAISIDTLQRHGVQPTSGDVVVTGATGGVGSMAVSILAKLGYHVVAVTGKESAHEYLRLLGAHEILPRSAVDDRSGKPLLSGRWAGAVDTVGGNILGTILRAVRHGGCVAACGLVAGNDLPVTVYPFILRGVTLAGVDAALFPMPQRKVLWQKLAGPWKPARLQSMEHATQLSEIPHWVGEMLAGRVRGRVVVEIAGEEDCGK